MTGKEKVIEVLDTCAWQDLVDTKPELLGKLVRLSRYRAVHFGVPDVVKREFSANADGIDKKRARWKEEVDALERLARQLDFEAAQSGRNYENRGRSVCFEDALAQMNAEIRLFPGFREQEVVHQLLRSEYVVQIPTPGNLSREIVDWGNAKKKPFGEGNGTADTELLLSVVRWASRRKHRVRFHTSNYSDFSVGKSDKRSPHPDIANFFSAGTNLEFCLGLTELEREYGPLRADDFGPFRPNGCLACGTPTEIEYMDCVGCGEVLHTPYSANEFCVEEAKNGYYICTDGERKSCSCGRKTFDGVFEKFCVDHRGDLY